MADSENDLDALVRRVDLDRWLASRFIADEQARGDAVAIYAYDHELARAPRVASNALMGEIRLTWWREVLDEIFEGRSVRAHPTAQRLAQAVNARGLSRTPLEAMIDARYRELDATPMTLEEALSWARHTGGAAAGVVAGMLDPGVEMSAVRDAGASWVLGRRAGGDPASAAVYRAALAHILPPARRAVRGMPVAAFPAVAHASLATQRARGGEAAEWSTRLRLLAAVATGRI